ncbi:DUF6225 family protein [Streptomyces sp. NPDC056437]|uniref:DUF6225 family protein n=1 Tax=Streptomyces sp. NPDC056437 TaxID=3345816 RepID=UPI0036A82EF7
MSETYEHKPAVWTAKRLREALAELPDDAPIHIGVAEKPGDFDGFGGYVLVDAEHVTNQWPATQWEPERSETEKALTLFADFQPGEYDRPIVD